MATETKAAPAATPPTMGDAGAQLARLAGQKQKFKTAWKEQKAKLAELTEVTEQLAKENDALRIRADNSAASKRVEELTAQIRDRAAYDRFGELARERGAKDSAIKALWKLAGYQAETDDPDDDKLTELLDGLKAEADFAFEPAAEGSGSEAAARAAAITKARSGLEIRGDNSKPAGGGRSGRNGGQDGTIITAEMRADPKFMLNPANRELIAQAAREHRFR